MSPTMQTLGIDRLSVEERIALVQEIWDSVADDESGRDFLTSAQQVELQRRLAEGPGDGVPWEQVHAETLERFRR